jgi:hypothetical protein
MSSNFDPHPESQYYKLQPSESSYLREYLSARFSLPELKEICSDLGIDYEDFDHTNKTVFVPGLIGYAERTGKKMLIALLQAALYQRYDEKIATLLQQLDNTALIKPNQTDTSTQVNSNSHDQKPKPKAPSSLPTVQPQTLEPVTCLFICSTQPQPEPDYSHYLVAALRETLEQAPYYWQVAQTNQVYYADTLGENLTRWISRSNCYIVDVSMSDPDVMLALGMIRASKQTEQPVILLKRAGAQQPAFLLGGEYQLEYPEVQGKYAVQELNTFLRNEFQKLEAIQRLKASYTTPHYLSTLLLTNSFGLNDTTAQELNQRFPTIESLVAADLTTMRPALSQKLELLVRGLQPELAKLLQGRG